MFKRKIDPSNCTVIEFAWAKTGSLRGAAQVLAFIEAWKVQTEDLGREPTIEEYADYWRIDRATAFRSQARFREVFDRVETPGPVIERMNAERSVVGLGDLVPA